MCARGNRASGSLSRLKKRSRCSGSEREGGKESEGTDGWMDDEDLGDRRFGNDEKLMAAHGMGV